MADFKTAVLITLQHEGGFQKDPNDRANWTGGRVNVGRLIGTKYGITALDMPGVDISQITQDQAIAYYAGHFWNLLYTQISSQPVANKLFDMGVLFGIGMAVELLQYALDLLPVDGAFGPKTLATVNYVNADDLLKNFKLELHDHASKVAIANPAEEEDLPGWNTRIDS